MSDPAKILIVDDEPFNVDVLEQELELLGYQTVSAGNGSDALNSAETENPDLILLDVVMPAMDGFEVCERLKASAATKDIPVIFMTALSETADKVKAFSIGGVDYIMKPLQNEELLARVRTHLELRHAQLQLIEQNARLRQEIEAHQQSKATIEYLREEIKTGHNFEEIVGESKVLRKLLEKLQLVANDLVGRLRKDFKVLEQSQLGARFVSSAVEGLDTILLTLIDLAKKRSTEDAMMTSEDGKGVSGVRSAYLAEESELDLSNRMKLLVAANHCERLIWLFGSLGRSYMRLKSA